MNIPLPLFGLFMLVLLVLALRAPRYLLLIWPITLLVGQTTRTLIGPAPFYWYDATALVILARLYLSGDLNTWPHAVPRWHWWFVAAAFLFGTLVPIGRYGLSKEMFWILAHSSLAWMAFAIGLGLYLSPRGAEYRRQLGFGLLGALTITAGIALLQFGDETMAIAVNRFFNRDLTGSLLLMDDFAGQYNSSRVNGPWGGPNEFGGTTAIAAAIGLLLFAEISKKLCYACLALAAVVVATTVSRQVLVAAAIGAIAGMLVGSGRGRARIIGALALVLLAGVATGAYQNWSERLARWEGGIDKDTNVMGRLVVGPQRLIKLIEVDPSVVVVGVGLDVQKLTRKVQDKEQEVGIYRYGFASNSFLLPLYYLGITGFVLTIAFWGWVLRRAWLLTGDSRALAVGVATTAIFLVAADNYAFMFEVTVTMLFLLGATIAGRWVTDAVSTSAPAAQASPQPQYANLIS